MKYRKKPVVIEAMIWDGSVETRNKLGEWLGDKFQTHGEYEHPTIKTLEGDHICSVGDYIVQGVKGEFYPVKPDIFKMTYNPLDGEEEEDDDDDELDIDLIKKYLTALELKPNIKYLLVVSKDAMRHEDVVKTLDVMKDIGVSDSAAIVVNGNADQVKLIELPDNGTKQPTQ